MSADKKINNGYGFNALMIIYSAYLLTYSVSILWLLVDGLVNKFSSLKSIWSITGEFPAPVVLLLFTVCGSILGGAVLNIISFHKHYFEKKRLVLSSFGCSSLPLF